ncbi:hypothetical protein RRG08_056224 [Elysia crispata]|uniref:Secreted protein n=1 Tax=Elysia crispata TaxID=231223 RepID=A0AAE0YKN4_9GAST|nr:hypothetical protein RRG08_056224 [Elysia crispata]
MMGMVPQPVAIACLVILSTFLTGSSFGYNGDSDASVIFPWLDTGGAKINLQDGGLLSRNRRSTNDTEGSKNIWQKIESTYNAEDPKGHRITQDNIATATNVKSMEDRSQPLLCFTTL